MAVNIMGGNNKAVWGIPLAVLGFFGMSSLFVVSEIEQAIVLQFGELVRVIRSPGLQFKVPFVQDVIYYDKRILEFDVSATEVTLGDQKRVVVDTFSRYRIVNPILFFKTVRNEAGAQGRLAALITGNLRSILGASTLGELLSANRVAVMHKIKDQVNIAAKGLGIELVDVRICRADLPQENSQAIFERMISERVKEAKQLSAEGRMKSQIIRSNADLTCTTIVATGQQEAETIKGEGDKKAQEITRKAYAVDPEFAAFYQTLQGYEKALDAQTSYVLSSDNVFLRYFNVNKSVTRGD